MSNTSKILLVTIIATSILLGLGYAAIQNITLNITGNVAAQVNSENFKVRFIGTPTVSDSIYTTAKIVDDTNATIEVSGLTSKGQKVTASYDIKNESGDLSADLNVVATTSNMEYFTISSKLGKQSLVAGETTNVLVTVELTKTPISGPVSTDIDIKLTAIPVQPGEEGKTEGITDFSQTMTGLTSYGFFTGQVYSGTTSSGELQSVIFYEDGSMEYYRDGKFVDLYPAGTAIYLNNTIDVSNFTGVENSIVTVSNEGKKLDFLGTAGTLDEDFFEVYGLEEGTYYGRNVNGTFTWLKTMAYEFKSLDYYLEGDYIYWGFDDGWLCSMGIVRPSSLPEGYTITSKEKTSYGEILSYINNMPVVSINYLYNGCSNLLVAPEIPETVTAMAYTFSGCTKLTKAPKLPSRLIYMDNTFGKCTSLITAPEIPSTVSSLTSVFSNCTSLRGDVVINSVSLDTYDFAFYQVDMRNITLKGNASKDIKNQVAIISRQENTNFNKYYNDGTYQVTEEEVLEVIPFEYKLRDASAPFYLLTCI